MKLEEIAEKAEQLPEEERASLASRLLHGLQTPVYSVSDEEVFDRMREADRDPAVWMTFGELVSDPLGKAGRDFSGAFDFRQNDGR